MALKPEKMFFQRQPEPREQAFTLLVPQGWQLAGGIFRADLMHQPVTPQTIAAKLDFGAQSDAAGSIMLRLCPDILYVDPRWLVMPPMGGVVNGALVQMLLPAVAYLVQMVFPWAHPYAQQAQLREQKPAPELIQQYQRDAGGVLPTNTYDAAIATYTYVENGRHFQERAHTVIENMGQLGVGAWWSRNTWYYRAPVEEFAAWEGVLEHMRSSIQVNRQWAIQEGALQQQLAQMAGMAQRAEQQRMQARLETQRYLQQTAQEIADHRRDVNAEIRNDSYLWMTNQEEYVNPYNPDEIQTGSNQWQYRWTTPDGQEFYTDSESDNPNWIDGLNKQEWQRSQVRPRRG